MLSYLFVHHVRKWVSDYGWDHISVERIVENALRVQLVHEDLDGSINLTRLYEYGAAALKDMNARNSLSQVLTSDEPFKQLLHLAIAQ